MDADLAQAGVCQEAPRIRGMFSKKK